MGQKNGVKPSAIVVADSLNERGDRRLTTMEVTMHRFVLAEFNTHRVFSRNSASSRAIPIAKRIRSVVDDPAMPLEWGANQAGMQAGELLPAETRAKCIAEWLVARDAAVASVAALDSLGLHKQVANRLLEPFLWHTVIVSSTEWDNFFRQRCSPLAQPEIRLVAEAMRDALAASKPRLLAADEWHTPYVQPDEEYLWPLSTRQMISVARCARVSYLTHDGRRDVARDVDLYDRLISATPPHASPFEHVARSQRLSEAKAPGNFEGWSQLRHELNL